MVLFYVLKYEFCLRTQREGLTVHVGLDIDTPEILKQGVRPFGVHVVDKSGTYECVFVMARRKNRSQDLTMRNSIHIGEFESHCWFAMGRSLVLFDF